MMGGRYPSTTTRTRTESSVRAARVTASSQERSLRRTRGATGGRIRRDTDHRPRRATSLSDGELLFRGNERPCHAALPRSTAGAVLRHTILERCQLPGEGAATVFSSCHACTCRTPSSARFAWLRSPVDRSGKPDRPRRAGCGCLCRREHPRACHLGRQAIHGPTCLVPRHSLQHRLRLPHLLLLRQVPAHDVSLPPCC